MSESAAKGNVRFIRKNGRIIPIRSDAKKSSSTAGNIAGGSTAVIGTAVAADAARTRRVYERGGHIIDRKKYSFQPFTKKVGDKLVMRKLDGTKVGQANWYQGAGDKPGSKKASFSWLGVKSKYRGEGHSKTLSRVAAHEMKKSGVHHVWNQVVHEGSLKTNVTRHDTFWKAGKQTNTGVVMTKVTKDRAIANIRWHRKTKGIITSDIFRNTNLKKQATVFPGIRKAYMTKGMKMKLGVGLGLAVLGAGSLLYNNLARRDEP